MDTIKISKPVIKSPSKKLSNSFKNDLKKRLNSQKTTTVSLSKSDTGFKKIKLSPKKSTSKSNKLFIPTELSIVPTPDTKSNTHVKSDTKQLTKSDIKPDTKSNPITKPVTNPVIKSSTKSNTKSSNKSNNKLSKKLARRKKSTKNKTISVNLSNKKANKEKDIMEIIGQFEKMDIKEIKTFLKNKGIDTKNNNKSKLLPYLYLLTCVDGDINVIKT